MLSTEFRIIWRAPLEDASRIEDPTVEDDDPDASDTEESSDDDPVVDDDAEDEDEDMAMI